MQFLRRNTTRKTKITLPGPFTMAQQAKNEFYKDDDEMVMDFAAAVNEEVHDLAGRRRRRHPDRRSVAAQRSGRGQAHRGARRSTARSPGLKVPTVVHLCFGYARVVPRRSRPAIRSCRNSPTAPPTRFPSRPRSPSSISACCKDFVDKTIVLGVIELATETVETPQMVAERIRAALKYIDAEAARSPAPDCGMKYLSRESAFGKLKALSDGAAIVRKEIQ